MSTSWLKSTPEASQVINTELHGNITPAEIRAGEPIRVSLSTQIDGQIISKTVRAWRLSPLGLEVVATPEFESLPTGHLFDVELSVGTSTSKLSGVMAVTKHQEKDFQILGIRLCSRNEGQWSGNERRGSQRWVTSREFMPAAIASNPGGFNDFIYFKVTDISSTGLQMVTSLRNKFIFVGMRLDCILSLPLVGQVKLLVEVANYQIGSEQGKEVLQVGCKYVKSNPRVMDAISQYVFQFGPPASLKELKESGLRVKTASAGVEFRYVRTKEEFDQVLALRKMAYEAAGKLSNPADVTDVYDTRSRIIIGVYKGQVVASTRLIFNELSDEMEHEQFVKFPESIPRKDEICEITRVCTHPDYRGSDLLLSLLRFVAITVAQSGRKYILGSSASDLLPMYLKMGFESTKINYKHAVLNNMDHTIFIVDAVAALTGKGVNPIFWNIVWGSVAQYLAEKSIIEDDPVVKIRMGFYRLFKPLSVVLQWFAQRPRQSKRSKKAKAN